MTTQEPTAKMDWKTLLPLTVTLGMKRYRHPFKMGEYTEDKTVVSYGIRIIPGRNYIDLGFIRKNGSMLKVKLSEITCMDIEAFKDEVVQK